MEYTLPSPAGMLLVASGSRPLPIALSESLRAVWGSVREGHVEEGQLLAAALRAEVLRLHAFHFRGALWILLGDDLEQVDQGAGLVSVHHPVSSVLFGELGERLKSAQLEPGFVLDDRRALWFLKGMVDDESAAFPVVFDASPGASERWQVLYPDLELSPNDWRITANEPRTLFATSDEDVFELRGSTPSSAAGSAAGVLAESQPVTTRWTLRLARGRYYFGEAKATRALPPLLSTASFGGAMGRERSLSFALRDDGSEPPVITASRRGCEDALAWFKPYDKRLRRVDTTLCRGSVQGDEAITLDVTSPDALTVRYWRTPR